MAIRNPVSCLQHVEAPKARYFSDQVRTAYTYTCMIYVSSFIGVQTHEVLIALVGVPVMLYSHTTMALTNYSLMLRSCWSHGWTHQPRSTMCWICFVDSELSPRCGSVPSSHFYLPLLNCQNILAHMDHVEGIQVNLGLTMATHVLALTGISMLQVWISWGPLALCSFETSNYIGQWWMFWKLTPPHKSSSWSPG